MPGRVGGLPLALATLTLVLSARSLAADAELRPVPERVLGPGLTLEAEAGIAPETVEAVTKELKAALEVLPERLRAFPGGPLRLRLHPEAADFGMGGGEPSRPEWSEGRRIFHLYGWAEPDDPRALFRPGALKATDRERLWRRRALVHAIVERWDALLKWSQRKDWARITGWSGARPANDYAWAYSRRLGMQSAGHDFVTFAEEALVTPEQLRPGAVPVDDRVECQEFGKTRLLWRAFDSLVPRTRRPVRPRPHCPAFEAFADLEHLERIELLLSAPSGIRPQSLFGHLLIRPVHRAGTTRRYELATEVAALSGWRDPPLEYFWRGLTGGYPTVFTNTALPRVLAEASEADERVLRRFRLNLDQQERERVMERLWELERRGYPGYAFFNGNCASYVAWLLNGALDASHLIEVDDLAVLPTAVLDAALRETTTDAQGLPIPLLVREADDLLSPRVRAERAERTLRATVERLIERAPTTAARWRSWIRRELSAERADRQRAHRGLAELAELTLAEAPDVETARALRTLAESTVLIERYPAQAAEQWLRTLERDRMEVPPGTRFPTSEELAAQRQARYQREAIDRETEELRDLLRRKELMESFPRRPESPGEIKQKEAALADRRSFLELTVLYGELIELLAQQAPRLQVARAEGSGGGVGKAEPQTGALAHLGPSGLRRFSLGVVVSSANSPSVGLLLRTALIRERLGEGRALALDPLTEVRAADGIVVWTPGRPLPRAFSLEVIPFRFITVPREPTVMRRTVLDHVGFAIDSGSTFRPDVRTAATHWIGADLVLPVAATPLFERHLLLRAGAVAELDTDWLPVGAGAGPKIEADARFALAGSRVAALRAGLGWRAPWKVWGVRAPGFQHEVRAALAMDWELVPSSGWMLEASADARWMPTSAEGPSVNAALSVEWP